VYNSGYGVERRAKDAGRHRHRTPITQCSKKKKNPPCKKNELLPILVVAVLGLYGRRGGGLRDAQQPDRGRRRPRVADGGEQAARASRMSPNPGRRDEGLRFGVSFYLVAMRSSSSDIEVVFLYPVGVILKGAGTASLVRGRDDHLRRPADDRLGYAGARGPSIGGRRRNNRFEAAIRPRHAARRLEGRNSSATSKSASSQHLEKRPELGAVELDFPLNLRASLLRDRGADLGRSPHATTSAR